MYSSEGFDADKAGRSLNRFYCDCLSDISTSLLFFERGVTCSTGRGFKGVRKRAERYHPSRTGKKLCYVIFNETWYKHPPPTWNISI